ncbi:C-type lectin protein [Lasiosphaeris hirsuta]|uniref:C-type lectin protein n=1 Tax=Lasiosphaeris hirsuta TaxID=260670 RepID=A0AA40AH10_9PEZI|nr:C-type lectin protein [Lasiosphaeris hirsuta]
MPSAQQLSVVPSGTPFGPVGLKTGRESGMPRLATNSKPWVDIIDIRQAVVENNLKAEILSMFHSKEAPRRLPTLLLYDERGLQLFEGITYLEEYYLTNDEIEVLRSSAVEMVKSIPSGAMVIELGSGNLRKVNLLLQALEDAGKKIDYYALDLSQKELERTLAQLPAYNHVSAHGLFGTYDDGRAWLRNPANASRQKCILSLGSSIGNFNRVEAAIFLKNFADVLGHGDTMLIGLDSCDNPAKVYHAYNDCEGLTHKYDKPNVLFSWNCTWTCEQSTDESRFILNGLRHANGILGEPAFVETDWRVIGEYVFDGEGGRHQAFYAPLHNTVVMGELVRPHERIQVEESLKYSSAEAQKLWNAAGMTETSQWRHGNEYGLHMLTKPIMSFSLISSVYARGVLPTLGDWEALWAAWDIVTREMLPHEELLEKPIKLRNACIFYLGHIPTFLDIQLAKATEGAPSEPAYFSRIFERGIDPDVDNPELCHAHSEIPDEWPPVDQILAYQECVRSRLRDLYAGDQGKIVRHVGRAIWVGFEHELMHIETLLYMMLQSDRTQPPSHIPSPHFEQLATKARSERVANEWFDIPAQEITIGLDDPEDGTDANTHFGWDNEKPSRDVKVHAFQAKGRPISNEEYAQYMYSSHINRLPACWAETDEGTTKSANGKITAANGAHGHGNGYANGGTSGSNRHAHGRSSGQILPESFLEGKAVRTVYGLVPLKYALDWPIFASYDELVGCATWMGGRIPSFEEARSIYTHVDMLKKKDIERQLGKTVPAVNGHLSNNGVEITPPSTPTSSQVDEQGRQHLFLDLDDANVGFRNWHPVAVTGCGDQLAGQSEMGGVWEWTSTVLRPWESFTPMPLYPGYTADFFDEKHNIVLGGSWATHPRIAGRKTFVNWYQRNYPYAWVGARLVRDID